MGIFNDIHRLDYKGSLIEVECRGGFARDQQYDLIVNGHKIDSIRGSMGTFYLRGEIPAHNGDPEQIKVEVNQGFFGADYFLCAGNRRFPFQKATSSTSTEAQEAKFPPSKSPPVLGGDQCSGERAALGSFLEKPPPVLSSDANQKTTQ